MRNKNKGKLRMELLKPSKSQYRDRFGYSLMEMASILGWSKTTIWNCLNLKGARFKKDKKLLFELLEKDRKRYGGRCDG